MSTCHDVLGSKCPTADDIVGLSQKLSEKGIKLSKEKHTINTEDLAVPLIILKLICLATMT